MTHRPSPMPDLPGLPDWARMFDNFDTMVGAGLRLRQTIQQLGDRRDRRVVASG